ncbi:SHOCT domain-containing protein [Streptomyces sp. SS1-1]|nr:SHOCT domain-containing protein [Streptomyces sp. SS1-1]
MGQQHRLPRPTRRGTPHQVPAHGPDPGQDPPSEQPSAPAPASAPQPTTTPVEQLRQLAELRDAGILSDEEFTTKKAEILARM